MKHLIINLIILNIIVIFLCYRFIDYLCGLLVKISVFIGDDDFVKLSPYQLDLFALKKKLLK